MATTVGWATGSPLMVQNPSFELHGGAAAAHASEKCAGPRGGLISRLAVMPRPEGFDYVERAGEVIITHRGKQATVLRGVRAASFLEDVEAGDPQELMARLTGNYRRGNERQARQHPRNRSR